MSLQGVSLQGAPSGNYSAGQIVSSVRAAFGVFVTDAILSDASSGGDPVELVLATVSVIAALWKYMHVMREWKEGACALDGGAGAACTAHWRVASVVFDLALLIESVCAILLVRILTQAAQDSVGTTSSRAVYLFVSLLVFVGIDAMSKLRRRVPGGAAATSVQVADALASGKLPASGMMWGFAT
jgi:hypothetical protein